MTSEDLLPRTAPASARSAATRPLEPKSTTRKTLRILCVVLLVATTVVFSTSLWVFQKIDNIINTVHTNTAPAIITVLATQTALVETDRAAISSIGIEPAQLIEPGQLTGLGQLTERGQGYQSRIELARTILAQAAEDYYSADQDGSQKIQLVERLLVSYQNLIRQTDANFRESGGSTLGVADLWYASHLLHNTTDNVGILAQLKMLLDDQTRALELSANSMTVGAVLVWLPPILVLFVALCLTQVFLKRHFRRTLNPPLLLATVLLVGLSVVMSLTVISQHRLQDSRVNLDKLINDWEAQINAADAGGQRDLRDVVTKYCDQLECGVTVTEFAAGLERSDQLITEIREPKTGKAIEDIADAREYAYLWFLIPLGTVLIAVLILLGLRPRIEEYRYRPR